MPECRLTYGGYWSRVGMLMSGGDDLASSIARLIVALGMPECRLTYGGYWSRVGMLMSGGDD
ncbi:hypothetical protein CQA67_33360, partial [Klebsiella pneumoniae]